MGSMGPVLPGARGPLATGWLAAFGTSGYEDELPLLEELGINFGHIKVKVGGKKSNPLISTRSFLGSGNGSEISRVEIFYLEKEGRRK